MMKVTTRAFFGCRACLGSLLRTSDFFPASSLANALTNEMLKHHRLVTRLGFLQDWENTIFMVVATEHVAYSPRH